MAVHNREEARSDGDNLIGINEIVDAIFYGSPDGICLFTNKVGEIFVNQRLCAMLGLECNIWRRDYRSIAVVPQEVLETIKNRYPFLFEHLKDIESHGQLQIRTQQGADIYISVRSSTFKTINTEFQCVFVRDVSDVVNLTKRVELADSILRHEVLNHAGGISSLSGLLHKRSTLIDEDKKLVEAIITSADDVTSLVNERGNLMKLEEQELELKVNRIDFIRMLKTIRSRLSSLSTSREVYFDVLYYGKPLDEAPSLSILGDRDLLERALENLIKNSIEASPGGKAVLITLTKKDGRLEVDIHNEGVIPEKVQETFFQEYTSSKGHGHGIGVYLSNLIVLTHQGSITFRTSEEEGTHVIIQIPLKQDENV